MNLKLSEQELDYLVMVLEQNMEDWEEDFGESYREMLQDLFSKLIVLKSGEVEEKTALDCIFGD